MPFYQYYFVPGSLLLYNRDLYIFKLLTIYHATVFTLYIIFILTMPLIIINILPEGPFYQLSKYFGLVFVFLGIRSIYYTELNNNSSSGKL